MLKVHDIFNSIMGEGSRQGIQMSFIRLYGCNRTCNYCDQPQSDFVEMEEEKIVEHCSLDRVCITGGEPLMQSLYLLTELLNSAGKEVNLETNGDFNNLSRKTYTAKGERIFQRCTFNHVVCSPKVKTPFELKLASTWIDDLKILVDTDTRPSDLKPWEEFGMDYGITLFLQPKNLPMTIHWDNFKHTLKLLQDLHLWNLSPQLHKLIGVK